MCVCLLPQLFSQEVKAKRRVSLSEAAPVVIDIGGINAQTVGGVQAEGGAR